ncbi:NUDIX domain-containing protein [Nocardia xishanensis]
MADYIRWLRERVGHDHIQLAYAAACVVSDGRVLMQRRSDDGRWGLPGGAIELGESAASAVVREVAAAYAGCLSSTSTSRHVTDDASAGGFATGVCSMRRR